MSRLYPLRRDLPLLGVASIFDITLKARLADDEEVNIGGDLRAPVEICLPVPEGISNPVIIYYKETWKMLETQRVDGNAICAHAANFSYYGVGSAFNDVPKFANSTPPLSIPENTAAGQNIGNPVTATDRDGDTLIYSLEGMDAASFDIDPNTGQIKTKMGVTYNYEVKNSYSVKVKVVDGQGGSATISVTINLTDVDGEGTGQARCAECIDGFIDESDSDLDNPDEHRPSDYRLRRAVSRGQQWRVHRLAP